MEPALPACEASLRFPMAAYSSRRPADTSTCWRRDNLEVPMIARALTVCAGFVLCSSTALAQQADTLPRQPERGRGIVTATRFATTLSLPAERGPAGSLSVSLGKLSLSGGRRIDVPPMGFYVATLVTGDVVTNVGG